MLSFAIVTLIHLEIGADITLAVCGVMRKPHMGQNFIFSENTEVTLDKLHNTGITYTQGRITTPLIVDIPNIVFRQKGWQGYQQLVWGILTEAPRKFLKNVLIYWQWFH